jgi:hypothetical protein
MRYYLERRTEAAAVVLRREMLNKCGNLWMGLGESDKWSSADWGDTPHFCGVEKRGAA